MNNILKVKIKKEAKKKEQIEKKRIAANSWTMLSWITAFINENQEEWNTEREKKFEDSNRELEYWKMIEKI